MSESGGSLFAEGLRRAQAGFSRLTPKKAQPDDVNAAVLARAVTAGAVAGAYAGAVAGASAAAASVHVQRERKGSTPTTPMQTPALANVWQRTWDPNTGAWYYWHITTRETTWTPPPELAASSTPTPVSDVALDLARTVTLDEYVDKSGFADRTGGASTPLQRSEDEPSLYAQDTDIEHAEEVCQGPF